MPALTVILALAVTLVAGALIWLLGRQADARRVERLSARPDLASSELWREFYRNTDISLGSVETALRLVSDATQLPPGKLRPSDRFADELAPERGWEFDDGLAQIHWHLESLQPGAGEGLQTIDDLIRRISELRPQAHAEPPPKTHEIP